MQFTKDIHLAYHSAYTWKSKDNAFHRDMHLIVLMLPTRNQSTMHFTKDRISILTIYFWKSKDNAIQYKVHGNAQYGILTFEGMENAFKHLKQQGVESKLYLPLKKMKIIFWKHEGSSASNMSTCVSHIRTCSCFRFCFTTNQMHHVLK